MSDFSQQRTLFELITGKAFAPPGKTYETGGPVGQLYGNMSDNAPSYMDKSANWNPPQGSQSAANSLYGNAQQQPMMQMQGMPGSMQNITAMGMSPQANSLGSLTGKGGAKPANNGGLVSKLFGT